MLWVYFIQAGTSGPVKIGSAVNVQKRLAGLRTGNYEALHVVATLPDPDGTLEMRLHRRFAHCRIRGEWFRADDPLLSQFIADAINDELPEPLGEPRPTTRCHGCPFFVERALAERGSYLCDACLTDAGCYRDEPIIETAAALAGATA